MKGILIGALALGFAATAAHAQTGNPPPPPPGQAGPQAAPDAPPPPDDLRGPRRSGPDGMHGRHGWHPRHMMMMSKAAHFRIRNGDMLIDVRCAEADSTAACGQTVMQILDQLQSGQTGDTGDDGTMNE